VLEIWETSFAHITKMRLVRAAGRRHKALQMDSELSRLPRMEECRSAFIDVRGGFDCVDMDAVSFKDFEPMLVAAWLRVRRLHQGCSHFDGATL
jgi:hypothetical protein